MNNVKQIVINSIDGQKIYSIEDSAARTELANIVEGAPEELDSFKEAFEKFKENDDVLPGIIANITRNANAINAETTRAQAAEKANADAISEEATRAAEAEKELQEEIELITSSLLGNLPVVRSYSLNARERHYFGKFLDRKSVV